MNYRMLTTVAMVYTNDKYNKILNSFRENGGRFTRQRENILKAVLENPGCTCKELYYIARQRSQKNVSRATVYRMVNELERMGYISRRTELVV